MNGKLLRISLAIVCMFALAPLAFSQAQAAQNRIPQQIVIGGQQANGAYVTASTGGMQSFTCSNPQQYATPDGGSQGWACYDQATGVWLLNAVPPAAAQAPAQAPQPVQAAPPQQPGVIYQQPAVVYQQPAPVVVYAAPGYGYGYPYAYGYYGYGYGYPVYSRGFSVGIGFGGFRGGFRGGRSGRR
jgi:hypothetical protein